MFSVRNLQVDSTPSSSGLLDQNNFYDVFLNDLAKTKYEAIIESPFISYKRLNCLLPIFHQLVQRKVWIIINTKPPEEQDSDYRRQVEECISVLLEMRIEILITGGHHRKLAIIDRQILYEGSLNILSQNDSSEIMRRIHSEKLAMEMINFTGISKFIG